MHKSAYAPVSGLYDTSSWKTIQTPILQCTNKERDLFTISNASIGNKKLTYPVGLITSDEVVFAGGFGGSLSRSYYLYTDSTYWTMSPYVFDGDEAYIFRVSSVSTLGSDYTASQIGLRPVINLRADTQFTGTGSETSPFEVVS